MLDSDTFLGVVNHTPLVAVDLVLVRGGQEVLLGHVLHLPAHFAVPGCDAQHAELRWWPVADALAHPQVHGFTKDYLVAQNK